MTTDKIIEEMMSYLDSHQSFKEEILELFNYTDPMIDYSKGVRNGPSAAAFYGTLEKAIGSYLKQKKVTSLTLQSEIESECDYFYWRLLVNVLVSIFMQKKQSKVYTNPQKTKSFSLDAAGPKYCYAYNGFGDISFVLWAKDKSFEHIKLLLKFGRREYSYSLHGDDLINKNIMSITGKYNGTQVTLQGTLPEITRNGGIIEEIVKRLTSGL